MAAPWLMIYVKNVQLVKSAYSSPSFEHMNYCSEFSPRNVKYVSAKSTKENVVIGHIEM